MLTRMVSIPSPLLVNPSSNRCNLSMESTCLFLKQHDEFSKWREPWVMRVEKNPAMASQLTLTVAEQNSATRRRWLVRIADTTKRAFVNLLWLFLSLTALARAQAVLPELGSATCRGPYYVSTGDSGFSLSFLDQPVTLPIMAPDLALQTFHRRTTEQAEQLASYSATMLICAQLPNTSQNGEYELQERYSSPRALAFKAVRFKGDDFIKHNVILRLLQSEVDHLKRDDPSLTAITPANYNFSYKGVSQLEGGPVHVYALKPRHKRNRLVQGSDLS